jgi:hypothetical protein
MGTMLDTVSDPARTFRGLTFDAVAAYGNGRYHNYPAALLEFPRLHLLQIDVSGEGIGNCGDFEPGDMSYDHAGRWASGRLAAGVWRPVIYFSVSNWTRVMASLHGAGVGREDVRIWTAHYTGTEHTCSPACNGHGVAGVDGSADATQWGSSDSNGSLPPIYAHRDIDVSMTADDFWGDAPTPPPFQATLKVGSTGEAVETWQRQMARRGWHIAVNGTYDATHQATCKKFQVEKNNAVRGNVNRETWNTTWTAPITP